MTELLKRINAIGLTYHIIQLPNQQKTCISLVGPGDKSIFVDATLEQVNQAWYNWMNGKFVQDAFPFMNVDQREFIMTGITSSEWEEIFAEKEEDEDDDGN